MTRLERYNAAGQTIQRGIRGRDHTMQPMRRMDRRLLFVGYVLSVFTVSLTATVAVGFFVLQRIQPQSFTAGQLLQGDFISPVIAI
ncbi:hypothetical protein GF377_00550, partial [candidate division GN15 bacterium]|nr:hypothetical protein [candidate division GN15 bacterium]